jgi:hypothetical protein
MERLKQIKKILMFSIEKYEKQQRLRASSRQSSISDPILFFNSTNEQAVSVDSGRSSSDPLLADTNLNTQ